MAAASGNSTRDIVWIIVGVLLFTAGFMLLKNASGGGGGTAGTVILPSDAVQTAVISADQAEQSSSNQLSATVSGNALAAITGLETARDSLKLGLAQTSAATTQTKIAASSAAQIAQIQAGAQEYLGNVQAEAADTQAGYAYKIAGLDVAGQENVAKTTSNAQTAIAALQEQAAEALGVDQENAQEVTAKQQTTAEVNAADQARSASDTSSVFGTIGNVVKGLFSFSSPVTGALSSSSVANTNKTSDVATAAGSDPFGLVGGFGEL